MSKRKRGQRRTKTLVPWTLAEVRYLQLEWHELQQRTLHAGLTKLHPTGGRRTWVSIRVKAYKLGLPGGVPQGHESIKAAALRTGYCPRALLGLCIRYGLPIRKPYRGTRRVTGGTAQYVATDDIDAMLAEHHQRRTIAAWAAEFGLAQASLYKRITRAGGKLAPVAGGFSKHWLTREEIEPFAYPLKRAA